MRIFGDNKTKDICSENAIPWSLSSYSTLNRDLLALLVHEFGHVLELGDNPPTTQQSVMNQGHSNGLWRHLRAWDRNCAHRQSSNKGRKSYYKLLGLNHLGGWFYYHSFPYPTSRGFIGGRFQHYYDNNSPILSNNYYSLYTSSLAFGSSPYLEVQKPIGSGYNYYFNDYVQVNGLPNFNSTPLFTSLGEKDPTEEGARIFYQYYKNKNDETPHIRTIWTNNLFETKESADLVSCHPTNCSNQYPLRTDVPINTAYDPVSNKTVFVSVDSGEHAQGQIGLYAGLVYNSLKHTLNKKQTLFPSLFNMPSAGIGGWTYSMRTDFTIGIACADSRNIFDYNCLLAWNDSGHPGGHLLYTYFRVQNDSVIMYPTVWRRSGAIVTGGISAAYFNGRFHMAWKYPGVPLGYARTFTAGSSYSDWNVVLEDVEPFIIDSPTFMHHPTQGKALLWTTLYP